MSQKLAVTATRTVDDPHLGTEDQEHDEQTTDDGQDLAAAGQDDDSDPEGADQLGDPGKKALDAMKSERNAERKRARELQKQLDDLKAAQEAASKDPDEQALDQARREAREEALSKANQRIVRSEVKSAAAGKFRDPTDALAFIDLEQFEVDENGDVDPEEVAEAIEDLLQRKPHLAAQGGSTSFDSGRGKPRPKKKLTRDDLKRMSPDEIVKARREGRIET